MFNSSLVRNEEIIRKLNQINQLEITLLLIVKPHIFSKNSQDKLMRKLCILQLEKKHNLSFLFNFEIFILATTFYGIMALHLQKHNFPAFLKTRWRCFAATIWHCICSNKMALHLQRQYGIAFAARKWHCICSAKLALHMQRQYGIGFAGPSWHCICSAKMALHLQQHNSANCICIFEPGRFTSVTDKKI